MPLWNLTRTLTSAVLTLFVPCSACLVACNSNAGPAGATAPDSASAGAGNAQGQAATIGSSNSSEVAGSTNQVGASAPGGGSGNSGGAAHAGVSNSGQVVLFENFDAATLPNTNPLNTNLASGLWIYSADVPLSLVEDAASSYGGKGRSLRASYPSISGDESRYPSLGIDLAQFQTRSVFIRFRSKMPKGHHGLKFVKVFGQRKGDSYANTTFGLDYTGVDSGLGSMYCTSYGDGSGIANDTANILSFAGPGYPGRAKDLPGFLVATPAGKNFSASDWGTGWHLFELHVKFNSGTSSADEVNDGELFVRIDGATYLDAKGLLNRHPENAPIEKVEFLGWTQTARGAASEAFEIWYDNLEISLDGWGSSAV